MEDVENLEEESVTLVQAAPRDRKVSDEAFVDFDYSMLEVIDFFHIYKA
jgi:hypothetical protein